MYDACWTQGQDWCSVGKIFVFLNFKKVGEFDSKQAAREAILKLLGEAPDGFFDENKEVLLKDLC